MRSGRKFPYEIGPWLVKSSNVAFDNPWLTLFQEEVAKPDGSPGEYGVVHFKNRAIGILAIDQDGGVPLVGQHRFPLDCYSWELPEGGGPLDEPPLGAAKRELAEETGFTAGQWLEFGEFDLSNSVTDEQAICFIAYDLVPGTAEPEPSEVLQNRTEPFSKVLEMVLGGEIRDSLTALIVLSAHAKARNGDLPDEVAQLILKA